MSKFSYRTCLWLSMALLAGCGHSSSPTGIAGPKAPVPRDQLSRTVERYFDEYQTHEGDISTQALADALSVERRYLAELETIPRDALDPAGRLTYDIFKRQRELNIEGSGFPQ